MCRGNGRNAQQVARHFFSDSYLIDVDRRFICHFRKRKTLMSKMHTMLAATAIAAVAASASAAIIYNPVVTMIGDGTAIVTSQSRTTTIQVYANTIPGAPLSQAAFNSGTTGVRLTSSDSATSEGALSNNPGTADAAAAGVPYGGTVYTYSAGYDAANQTANVSTTALAPRAVGYMNATNSTVTGATVPVTQTNATSYDNNNIRSATGNDAATKYWTGGTGTAALAGWRYFNTNTQTSATVTNVRTTEIRNGQLFGSTGSGTRGIYSVGSGLPETGPNVAAVLVNTGASSSPYEFVLVDDPNNAASTATTFGYDTAYVADDSAIGAANGGIQKWVWNGTAWSNPYTLNDGVGNRGLAGQLDPDTGKVTLWATTAAGDKLVQVTDLGAGALSPFTTLATVPTNNLFRGVALTTTVPEPGTIGLMAIAGLALFVRRRYALLPVAN
jgi:PEP-CTERM motif